MAHKLANMVKQTSTSLGAMTLALTGAALAPYRSFSSVLSEGDTTEVVAVSRATGAWQAGVYSYSGGVLTMMPDHWISSSTGSPITFAPGLKDVFIAPLAEHSGPVTKASGQDDYASLQRAINVAALTNTPVVLDGTQTYVLPSAPLVIPSGVTIEGNGALIDCSGMAAASALNQVFGIKLEGSIGELTPLTASNAIGDRAIAVSTTDLAVGDIILVSSAEVHPVGAIGNSNRKGEMHRIRSIDSAGALTMMDGLFLSYDHTQTGIVQKITPVANVTIKNLRVKMGGKGKAHNGIRMQYTADCWLIGSGVSDAEDCGVRTAYCFGGGVNGGEWKNATSPADGGSGLTGVTGYGVVAGSGCRNFTIENAGFRNNRHSISGGGTHPPLLVVVRNNNIDGGRTDPAPNYDVDCHEDCIYWIFRDNKISGSIDSGGCGGLMVRGQYCIVDTNEIINARQYGILIHSFDDNPNGLISCKVTKNLVIGSRLSGIFSNGDIGTPNRDIDVLENTVLDCGGDGIIFSSTKRGSICTNTIKNLLSSNTSAIRLNGASDDKVTDILVANNRTDTVDLYSLNAEYAEHITVIGHMSKGSINAAVSYANCSNINHVGGDLQTTGATVHGIKIVDCTKITINGVTADGGVGATFSNAVSISGTSSDISVGGGCIFSRYQWPVRATGTVDYISVTGINGRNCTVPVDISAASHNVNTGNL